MQKNIAPDMQGRVFALTGSLSGAMAPIGLAIAGPMADLVGIQAWFIVAGCFTMGMGLVGRMLPAVWEIESNNPNKKVDVPAEAPEDDPELEGPPPRQDPMLEFSDKND
jgi:DHA3 family macrolide efflux protein-like MFS transporter